MADTVTLQDARRIFGIPVRELLAMIEDGRLEAVQVSGEIQIRRSSLEALQPS